MRGQKQKGRSVADYVGEEDSYARLVESHLKEVRNVLTACRVPQSVIEAIEIRNREIFQAQVYALQKSLRKTRQALHAHVRYWSSPEKLLADPNPLQSLVDYLTENSSEALAAEIVADLRRRFPRAHLRLLK